MKLYYSKGSCSEVPQMIARILNITLDSIAVDLATGKTENGVLLTEEVGKSYVPALQLDNGKVISEVPAIAAYLCQLVPNQTLFPLNGEAFIDQLSWLNFIATEIHKSYQPIFRRVFGQTVSEDWFETGRSNILKSYQSICPLLEKQAFLMGETLTCADLYLYTTLQWAVTTKVGLDADHDFKAYRQRVKLAVDSLS
ncbi:glutathione binding-like protein [Ignatzschineria larvae DSM 13226]|uniref:Glutathione binding-like protein n=1 Tax=Ignatzschineria larvae DSM 13226 TaxID=1111732 RepID=A0ABZ3C0I1_9GAMM|nr:glutathione binding-like protein [Ignatzschineria larvae]